MLGGIFVSASVDLVITATTSASPWRLYLLAIPWAASSFFALMVASALSSFRKDLGNIDDIDNPDVVKDIKHVHIRKRLKRIKINLTLAIIAITIAVFLQALLF